MITEDQKIFIKEFAATKPIAYQYAPTENQVRKDCLDYVKNVCPEWNLSQERYFYEMVKSTVKAAA